LDSYFVVATPGLEEITALEMLDLGIPADEVEPGGILCKGTLETLYELNLHLRTASRVLARLGNFFRATTFELLQQRLTALPWERFLSPGQPISLRVTCHKSKLYHSDAVARTASAALAERLGQPSPLVKADEQEGPVQLIIIRLLEDRCTVSLDTSGTHLHKRGYRQAVAKAPLRETLAAGILLASGWDRHAPLLDPFCGSGTIAIEAALLAMNIPPGQNRGFAFMDWRNFDAALWQQVIDQGKPSSGNAPLIHASDRDAGAVRMARTNAERAGVAEAIQFTCQAVSNITPPPGPGWVVTNPPYGPRLHQGNDLRDLYARFGDVLRDRCPGWVLAVLCSDHVLLGQLHLDLESSLSFMNGGLSVRLAQALVP
jgi:23S rRNA G2445 N2-methylase RlmL